MKHLWLRLDSKASPSHKADLLKAAEGHCDAVITAPEDIPLASNMRIRTASTEGDAEIKLLSSNNPIENVMSGEFAAEVVVKDASDEEKVLQLAESGVHYLIVRCPNWKVIPLENLIAKAKQNATLLADVSSLTEAKTALQTLELGVDGIVFSPNVTSEIEEMGRLLEELGEFVSLATAKVTSARPIGLGARVCVDTCE